MWSATGSSSCATTAAPGRSAAPARRLDARPRAVRHRRPGRLADRAGARAHRAPQADLRVLRLCRAEELPRRLGRRRARRTRRLNAVMEALVLRRQVSGRSPRAASSAADATSTASVATTSATIDTVELLDPPSDTRASTRAAGLSELSGPVQSTTVSSSYVWR